MRADPYLVRDEGVAGSNPATPTNTSSAGSTDCPTGARTINRVPGQLLGQKRRSALPPPRDLKNESPTILGAATGAEVQSALEGAASSCPKVVGDPNSTTAVRQDAQLLRIVIEPTVERPQMDRASRRPRACAVCASPFITSARLLLAEGHPADAAIEVWRP